MTRGRPAAALLIAFALATLSCGGGGGGGGGSTPTQPPPPPPPPPMGVFFEPGATPAAPAIYLAAAEESALDDIWELRVEVEGVEDLYGVAFRLTYPDDLLSFRPNRTEEGDFLSEAGAFETELLVDRSGPDQVTVGITRLGEEVGAEGSGLLLILRFAVVDGAEGMGDLVIDRNDTRGADGRLQEGVEWIEGALEILR